MVLCLNLEGLHGFELREKFVSGQCWCSMQDYHWLHNNCLKFANEFCRKLGSIQYKLPFVYIIYIYFAFPSSSSILIHPNVSTVSLEVLVEFLRGRKLGIAVQINFIQFAFESSEYQNGI